MKKILSLFLLLFFSFLLSAHEFWLEPEKFIYEPGDPINIRFLVGENFEGENWSGNSLKVNQLNFYSKDYTDDLSSEISDEKGDSIQISLYDEGTAMLTFNSNNSFINLDAEKFNEYLKEDGLQTAIDYRREHNESDSAGKEFFQRSVKTILQIGEVKDNTSSKKTNLPLDIIPLQNPYDLKENDSLTVKILFKKTPLKNAHIKAWNRIDNHTTFTDYTSDEKGEIHLPVNQKGKWMISTVKMVRLNNNKEADWQSYWGSLTWGYVN